MSQIINNDSLIEDVIPFHLDGSQHGEILDSHHPQLQKQLNIDEIFPYLVQQKLLTIQEREDLSLGSYSRKQKIDKLLLLLSQKGSDALWRFVCSLYKTSNGTAHKELANALLAAATNRYKIAAFYLDLQTYAQLNP